MAITKPTVDSATWANTATGPDDIATPGAGLFNTGFLAAVRLKRGYLNYWFNKLHQGLRYYMSVGLPLWDASETNYIVGSFVQYGGIGYRCTNAAVAGTNPTVDTAHWELMVPTPAGLLLALRVITATSNPAKTAGTNRARFRMVGGGGGAPGTSAQSGPAMDGSAGAASGSWGEFETTVIPATWTITIGAAGVGGAAPGAPGQTTGTAGTATTLSDGTNTFTCPGGSGSTGFAGGTAGAVPTATPGGTIIFASAGENGGDGEVGDQSNTAISRSGKGGGTPFGAGGASRALSILGGGAAVDGVNGTGYGSGGSGAVTQYNGGAGKKGGDGKPGILILEEWS